MYFIWFFLAKQKLSFCNKKRFLSHFRKCPFSFWTGRSFEFFAGISFVGICMTPLYFKFQSQFNRVFFYSGVMQRCLVKNFQRQNPDQISIKKKINSFKMSRSLWSCPGETKTVKSGQISLQNQKWNESTRTSVWMPGSFCQEKLSG